MKFLVINNNGVIANSYTGKRFHDSLEEANNTVDDLNTYLKPPNSKNWEPFFVMQTCTQEDKGARKFLKSAGDWGQETHTESAQGQDKS